VSSVCVCWDSLSSEVEVEVEFVFVFVSVVLELEFALDLVFVFVFGDACVVVDAFSCLSAAWVFSRFRDVDCLTGCDCDVVPVLVLVPVPAPVLAPSRTVESASWAVGGRTIETPARYPPYGRDCIYRHDRFTRLGWIHSSKDHPCQLRSDSQWSESCCCRKCMQESDTQIETTPRMQPIHADSVGLRRPRSRLWQVDGWGK